MLTAAATAVPQGDARGRASLFDFKGHNIRVVKIDQRSGGEPWFVAADVCRALGMGLTAGSSRWLAGLSIEEKRRVARRELPQMIYGSHVPSLNFVSESGLYKLVLRSDKPEAKPFQNWVTRVVLPSIRRDGGYIHGEEHVVPGAMTEDRSQRITKMNP